MASMWMRGGTIPLVFPEEEAAVCQCGPEEPGAVRADDGWRCLSCGRLLV